MNSLSGTHIDFDDIAELCARSCKARSAIIIHREHPTHKITLLGKHDFLFEFSESPPSRPLLPRQERYKIYRDVQNDPDLEGHEIRLVWPRVRTLLLAEISGIDDRDQILIGVHNVPLSVLDNADEMALFGKIVDMLRKQIAESKHAGPVAAANVPSLKGKFAEPVAGELDATAKFLLATLPERQILHARNGAIYVSLRTWDKEIKPQQMSAVSASKKALAPEFCRHVAKEIAAAVNRLYGEGTVGTVVPVPGGSSRTSASFSEILAEHVAHQLGVPCILALTPQVTPKGKSHPKKSVALQPYRLRAPLRGVVLLVDDVSTSGRHIELAQAAIRAAGCDCFAVCWIAGKA